jgi:hypothetical protein
MRVLLQTTSGIPMLSFTAVPVTKVWPHEMVALDGMHFLALTA